MGALAKQLGIDLGAVRALQLEHDDADAYKGFDSVLGEFKSRI